MTTWNLPHISKIYEALGAIGDDRIEFLNDANEAKMYSSSRNKFYTVKWNNDLSEMMANDNSAYWQGKLSYPMIAVLMLKDKIKYDHELPTLLKDIAWKEINKKFKNDFDKTVGFVLDGLKEKGVDVSFIEKGVEEIMNQVKTLEILPFGKKIRPPAGD